MNFFRKFFAQQMFINELEKKNSELESENRKLYHEYNQLKKLIAHEREVMNELREKEIISNKASKGL